MSWRKIEVDGIVWEYRMGTGNAVIRSTKITPVFKFIVNYSTLTGRSWDIIERGQRKKTSDGMVTPKHIADYIRKHHGMKRNCFAKE